MNFFTSIIGLAEVLLFLSIQTRPVMSQGNRTLQQTGFKPRLTNFKLDVHRLLEGARIRKKRHIREDEDLKNIEPPTHNMRVGKLSQEHALSYLSDYNLTLWISFEYQSKIQVLVGTQEGHLILLELSDSDDKDGRIVSISLQEDIASKAMAFTYFDEQWFVVLQSAGDSRWIRLYQRVGRGLERRQTIFLDGEADFDLLSVKGVHYLAVVTFRTSPYQSVLTLYHWTRTQFDKFATRAVLNARSVSCWEMDGNLYVAVAQEMSEEGDFKVGSPIFLYSTRDDDGLKLLQMIDTYGPIKVKHFYTSGSHYVIFFGRVNATIYWWSNDQFLLWQIIGRTSFASDASVLALTNGEVMIVITFQEEALFFALDGSGHYILTFAMTLSGDLASLQFMYSGKSYYALARFEDSRPQSVWKLILDSFSMPTANSFDPLQQCLTDVTAILNDRQRNLDAAHHDLGRVWLKNRNQTITTEVTVTGETSSPQRSIISYVLVVTEHKILPDTSMLLAEKAIANIISIVDTIQLSITGSVRKSLKQDVLGNKRFVSVISIPSLNLESTSVDAPINGFYISRISRFALRKSGNQKFTHPVRINHIYSQNVSTNTLNGLEPEDLLLLRGEQEITGSLKFSNVMADNVLGKDINSIPVENFVTVGSHQQIRELKSISDLNSRLINVHGKTNGEALREFAKRIVLKFGDSELNGRFTLTSPVEVADIFLTGLINDRIDLDQLAHDSVQKHTEQDLKGPFVITSPQVVLGNLDVAGYINGIDINRLMTLSTDQIFLGNVVFNELLTINRDLIVDYVNGIDLDKTAVLKTIESHFVDGFVTFSHSLTANRIDMTEYVVLDGVDPSLMLQDIVKHVEGVVKSNEVGFHNVHVLGHVTATGGINGHKISDLPSTVWLKTNNQQIEDPVNLSKISAKADMEVKLVNNLDLDKDFAHSFKNETITSFKSFVQDMVITEHIYVTEAVVNGFDIASLQNEMARYREDGTIHGVKTLQTLEIIGHVDAKILNNFDVDDIMHNKVLQEVLGEKRFLSELTVIPGDLFTRDVKFNTFNSIDFQKFIDNAVSRTAPKYVITNKGFWNIKAQDLVLAEGSTLGGIHFSQMLNRIVTLNTPQEIISGKRFLDSLMMERSSTVSHLNGEPWSNIVNNVAFVNEFGHITAPKIFNGRFQAEDLFNYGHINGVNITLLYENTFFKSGNNIIEQPITFMEDINIENDLQANSSINGLNWDHFIFIQQDDRLDYMKFLSDVDLLENMNIGGLINGCNITQLGLKILYTNKVDQFINDKVVVQSIQIVGNLFLKDIVNEIPVEELQLRFITVAGDQIITSPVLVESDLGVTKLNLDSVNYVDLAKILKDAVRHSVPQEILGYKNFHDITVNALSAESLFIIESLDDIDVISIFKNAVMKVGNRVIVGEKIFHSLKTDDVEILGYINGLQLPQDVVLTSTNDHISGLTFFLSNLNLVSDINVSGKIDGVDVASLIQNRVTLTEEQLVSTNLSFARDVSIHDLKISGTVNDLVLELICKVYQSFPLEGRKIFAKDIDILGSLSTLFINDYDVRQMNLDILRYNREGFLQQLQVFQNSLKAQNSLTAELIKGKSLTDMVSTFVAVEANYNSTLSYFGDLDSGLAHQINNQAEVSGSQILRFAYFILVQEISMGPTIKILHGYDLTHATGEFSHSMVIWTTEKQCSYLERCCHLEFSYWMRIKKSGHVMIEGDAEPGRFYPIRNPAPVTFDKNFVIWSNVAEVESKWCRSNTSEELMLASLKESGEMDIIMRIKYAPVLSDVKSFKRGHLYAVAGFFFDRKEDEYSSAVVYVFNEVRRKWSEHQKLPSFGVLSLDIAHNAKDDEILLAVGTGMGTYSSVYKWNDNENAFDLLENISPKYVTSTLWLNTRFIHLLAMSSVSSWPKKEGDCLEFLSGGQIDIYAYHDSRVKRIQSLSLRGVVSMISFTLAGDTFLVAASHQLQSVFIYEWKGYAGFSLINSMFVGEVRHLNVFTIGEDVYMTVAVTSGSSKLLKVVLQGKHAVSASDGNYFPLEQRDEAIHEEKFISGC